MPRLLRRRRRAPDPLGTGLWRRLHDDCVTASRRAPELSALVEKVRAYAEEGQRRWPSDSLDVPADEAGRAHYAVLRDVQRAFREVAYRTRLTAVPGSVPAQDVLVADALAHARTLLGEGP